MKRYIKTNGYYCPIEYQERDASLFRLCVAWLAGLSGAALFVGAVAWMLLFGVIAK